MHDEISKHEVSNYVSLNRKSNTFTWDSWKTFGDILIHDKEKV